MKAKRKDEPLPAHMQPRVPGHVVSMTIDWKAEPPQSVAHCECGFEHRGPWPLARKDGTQDAAIEAHWEAVRG